MSSRRQQEMLDVGARAPDFQIRDLDGNIRSLAEMLARGPVLLAFFKVSCPVCQYTFPFLERVYQGAGRDAAPVQIVGVSQDKPGPTREYNDEFGVTFPTLLDEAAANYPVSNAYGVHTVPSLFLVEQDGRITLSGHGFSKPDLESVGERLGAAPFLPGEGIPDFRPG